MKVRSSVYAMDVNHPQLSSFWQLSVVSFLVYPLFLLWVCEICAIFYELVSFEKYSHGTFDRKHNSAMVLLTLQRTSHRRKENAFLFFRALVIILETLRKVASSSTLNPWLESPAVLCLRFAYFLSACHANKAQPAVDSLESTKSYMALVAASFMEILTYV